MQWAVSQEKQAAAAIGSKSFIYYRTGAAMSLGGKECRIGADCRSREAVIDRLTTAFALPGHAAQSLAALGDALSTAPGGPLLILWHCPPEARRDLGDDYDGLRRVLEEAATLRGDVTFVLDESEVATEEPGVVPIFNEAEIARRVQELAVQIKDSLPDSFTVVGLLKGAFVFTADLVRALDRAGAKPFIEFLQVSSYALGKASTGNVKVIGGMPDSIGGRTVLLVDDIQDTGRTLAFTQRLLLEHGAAQVWTCALLDKPSRRVVEIEPDFVGFVIPDVFVVGYGIDYAERWRHLPFIGRVD